MLKESEMVRGGRGGLGCVSQWVQTLNIFACECTYTCRDTKTHMRVGWLRSVGSIKFKSLLQNIVSFIGLFCKRDL